MFGARARAWYEAGETPRAGKHRRIGGDVEKLKLWETCREACLALGVDMWYCQDSHVGVSTELVKCDLGWDILHDDGVGALEATRGPVAIFGACEY